MFGAQHGRDLPQVGSVALLLHTAWEGDGDNSLCDVDQVQLVALLQSLQQTHTPVRQTEKPLLFSMIYVNCSFALQHLNCAKTELRWAAGVQKFTRNLIPKSNSN